MNLDQAVLDRMLSLCRQDVREVLQSGDCYSTLARTVAGLQWQITVTRKAFELLFQHTSLETIVGASLAVAPIQAIVLRPPQEEALVVATERFAQLWSLESAVEANSSRDVQALTAERVRLRNRCLLLMKRLGEVAIIMDASGLYLEIGGKTSHLLMSPDENRGKVLEEVLPPALCVRWRYFLRQALQTPGRPYRLTYKLWVQGIERHYRAKFTGYGGEAGEVLILVQEVSPWLRR